MGAEKDTGVERSVAAQAAEWIARLDSETCTQAQREAFRRWRDADPLHAEAFLRADAMWRDSHAAIRRSPQLTEAAWQSLRHPRREAPRRGWLRTSMAAAATIALAAFVYLLVAVEPPAGVRHATVAGESRNVSLSDGSMLTLDTRTVLVERYDRHERRVDLLQGRAQFDVQGDPGRPFVVHAHGGTVTAIGTRFQVQVADAGAIVTLLEGVVRVAARAGDGPQRTVSLRPGQALRFDADGRLGSVGAADLRAVRGWTEGKLYVADWRLQDFVTEFNRYSDVRFRIDDPLLREERISGVFQIHDRDSLARLLEQGWDIGSRRVAPDEVLLVRQ